MNTHSNWPSEDSSRSAGPPWAVAAEPPSQVLGGTRALRGRPGGPGFEPNAAGSADAHSPWQRSQRQWSDSGVQWDALVTASPEARRPQPKYRGRHVISGLPAAGPLGAPVAVQDAPAELLQIPGKPASCTRRRLATIVLPAAVLATVAAVAITLLTGPGTRPGAALPRTIGMYSGQQSRGVFQQIDRVAGYGATIVTTGSQSTDGHLRQQFFVSTDGGATWRLGPVLAAGGGQPALGHTATLVAGGAAGWLAVGTASIWTSEDGLTWTLTSMHGITSAAGDQVRVLTGTATGFLAGGAARGHGAVWVSRDRVNWRQLGVARLRDITAAASHGPDTVISGPAAGRGPAGAGVWLSTDGGTAWARVAVPADHGAAAGIVGLSSDAAGFLAVRPGRTGGGVAYFSPDGRDWRYAGTIGPAGWSPSAVSAGSGGSAGRAGSAGFAVTGQTTAGQVIAYTSTGTTWTPTRSLGTATLTPAVAAGGTVVAAGSAEASDVGQRAVLLEADRAGTLRSVPLADLPGAVVPELSVNAMAAAGNVRVAVGSADGYPAIWRQQGGSWALVSSSVLTAVPHLAALTGVTRGPKGWLAVGAPGPLAFTSADGLTWRSAAGNIGYELARVSTVAVAAGPAGYVIAGDSAGALWWSPDLISWSHLPAVTGSGRVLAVAADAHGFVAVGSRDGRPVAWTTTDGRTWTMIAVPEPAGVSSAGVSSGRVSSAVLQRVAIKGNRVVALGQATTAGGVMPFAAVSADGGASWVQTPFAASPGASFTASIASTASGAFAASTAFTALIAGPHGFIAVGQDGHASPVAWTSADGMTWTRSRLSGVSGGYHVTALVPAGSAGQAVTAVGTIATQQNQGAFTVGIPAR